MARSNWVGIHALPATRAPRDVRGRVLDVKFRISDPRPGNATSGKYEVAVRLEVSLSVMRLLQLFVRSYTHVAAWCALERSCVHLPRLLGWMLRW